MPCAVCACEASSTFSHVLESKEGIKLKKGRPFWFIYRNLLNPDLYYIKSQIEREKKQTQWVQQKKMKYTFYILDFAGNLPLSKSVKFTEKSYHLAPIPFVLWFLILLCLSNSLLWHKNIWSGLFIGWQLDGDIRKKTLEEKLGYIWYLFLKIYILIF